MARTLPAVAWVSLAALAVTGAAVPVEAAGSVPSCMTVRAEARWVPYGYNHVVVLESRCDKDASCEVWTDVNPTKQHVDVRARTTEEVLTFRASPARVFEATAECRLAGANK